MKTRTLFALIFLASGALLLFNSCLRDQEVITRKSYTPDEYEVLSKMLDLPEETYDYQNPTFSSSASSFNHRATLGRVLFYDARLSANDQVACADCHHQKHGFADPSPKSEGFEGLETRRNSLMLTGGIEYYSVSRFFWDERAATVEEQIEMTLTDHIEMGADLSTLPEEFKHSEVYRILFSKAYGNDETTSTRIISALADFVRTVNSTNSRFEAAYHTLSTKEKSGERLYNTHCSGCHGNPQSRPGFNVANNGLDLDYEDKGVAEVTGNYSQEGFFKVPLLKNVALTSPYMHDGRFATLEEVIEHYSSGIKNHPNVSNLLRDPATGEVQPKNFSEVEKEELLAFLHTLTDEQFAKEPKWSNPFK